MRAFAELLSLYIERAGITDTELARAIGVSRQTIFRWREGTTSRPNKREDVLAISKKLRLQTEEQDNLLLAAGFRPEDIVPPDNEDIDVSYTDIKKKEEESGKLLATTGNRKIYLSRRLMVLIIIILAFIIIMALIDWLQFRSYSYNPFG